METQRTPSFLENSYKIYQLQRMHQFQNFEDDFRGFNWELVVVHGKVPLWFKLLRASSHRVSSISFTLVNIKTKKSLYIYNMTFEVPNTKPTRLVSLQTRFFEHSSLYKLHEPSKSQDMIVYSVHGFCLMYLRNTLDTFYIMLLLLFLLQFCSCPDFIVF